MKWKIRVLMSLYVALLVVMLFMLMLLSFMSSVWTVHKVQAAFITGTLNTSWCVEMIRNLSPCWSCFMCLMQVTLPSSSSPSSFSFSSSSSSYSFFLFIFLPILFLFLLILFLLLLLFLLFVLLLPIWSPSLHAELSDRFPFIRLGRSDLTSSCRL